MPMPKQERLISGQGIKIGIAAAIGLFLLFGSYAVVQPGMRGVLVTNGSVSPSFKPEGLCLKLPIFSEVHLITVKQQTNGMKAECYSMDLQQITASLKILYRVPEQSIVPIFQKYAGDPFESLIAPRANEAFKEVTASRSAERIVHEREQVKTEALNSLRKKVGNLLTIEDLVIENLELSKDLENAIESKMVQEQEKEKARFVKEKAEIDAQTAFIQAKGEANAINVRGEALRNNPGVISLTIAEKWNGVSPLVVSGSQGGASVLLPIEQGKHK